MKSSILYTFFILTVTYLLIVQAQQQQCTCGDLGLGRNPCSCSKTVVKAAELPKPTYYVSPEEINAAATVRNSMMSYQLPGPSQSGCSDSQSVDSSNSVTYSNSNSNSNSNPNTYIDSNSNTYSSEKSDSSAYSGSSSNANSNSNTYVDRNSNTYSSNSDSSPCSGSSSNANSDSNVYGGSNSDSYGTGDSAVHSSSDSGVYRNTASNAYGTPSSSSGSSILYSDALPLLDGYSNSNLGCGCNKRIVESSDSIETDDSISSSGSIVPRFPPIGDLCYPLPNLRSAKLLERTKVTPAYPGKIVCNSCNTVPYEICVHAQPGETTSRTIVSNTLDATSGSNPIMYGKSNLAVSSGSVSGTYPATAIRRTGAGVGSVSGSRLYGNFNSELSAVSRFGTYGRSNSGLFSRSSSRIYSLPSLAYANSNVASGQKQYAKISTSSSFSNCDDDIDETQVDHSYPEMPADAVSLTLAYKNLRAPNVIYRQGKQFVPEDKLSFGHRTVPNDVKNSREIPDIPEEKLVTVEKPVVELKIAPPRTVVIGSYDEQEEAKLAELEAIERESITQEETADQVADGLITYKDLGYAPVGSTYIKSQSYDGIMKGEINDSSEEPSGPLGPPIPDYVPGSVVVQQDVIKNEGCDNGEINKNTEIQQTNPSGFISY